MRSDELQARIAALAEAQAGVVTRRQLIGLGMSGTQARNDVVTERWRALLRGVYVTFTGPIPPITRTWAAVLYSGNGAAASHGTALWLAGMHAEPPPTVHVSIPNDRQLRTPAWMTVHRRRGLEPLVHTRGGLPITRFEEAVLDACDACHDVQAVITTVFAALQRRLTTPARLRAALERRLRIRWRVVMAGLLADAEAGVVSELERRYLIDVERRHGLPVGERNEPEKDALGRSVYRDVRYRPWNTLVELDGRDAHPGEFRARDRRRDNLATIARETTLRLGWPEVVGTPCLSALQVCQILRAHGWNGWGTPCGPTCDLSSLVMTLT
ncbi:hypothetical protein ACIB24_15820 [Spongisporangium articulatum]|uniref:Transcriptional regulator, AbiEi antitoxin, Type IV TA system n=1 Tax=Spongisporangium articulatum TaxID=3362603 RepID=A0ABW8AQC3_9ACTN